MKRRFYTVLILRHAKPKFRRLRVSYNLVLAAVAIGLLLGASGLIAPRLFFETRTQSVELARLEQENGKLIAERRDFETALARMSERLGRFEEDAVRLADELGVDSIPSERPAAGGVPSHLVPPERFPFDHEVRALRSRTETLNQSMVQIDDAFKDRIRMLAATPDTMPIEGWFSHGYGWRKDPFTGKREFHRGVDIVARQGTEIIAPADGTVSRAGRIGAYGKTVDLTHGFGYVTRYAHMSEIAVEPGHKVRRGDVIGLVGSTGRSTGPHLHYEVFHDGRRVNPWKYLGK